MKVTGSPERNRCFCRTLFLFSVFAEGLSSKEIWGWAWIAEPDILTLDMVSCRHTCIDYMLLCAFRWAPQSKQP